MLVQHEQNPAPFSWEWCEVVDYVGGLQLSWSGKNYLDQVDIKKLQDVILESPYRLLQENIQSTDSLPCNEDGVPLVDGQMAHELFKKKPLFLLNECHECLLNRIEELGRVARERFESEVVTRISDGYANVGGGFVFQDLVILTHMLQRNPNAVLDVHLIDPVYEEYILAAQEHGLTEIGIEKDFERIFFQEWYSNSSLATMRLTHELFKQLLGFLNQLCPGSGINFFLYRCVEDFLRDYESGYASLPQVIMSSDLGNYQEARRAFSNLVSFALQERQDAVGLSLDKDKQKGTARISLWSQKSPSG